MITRQDLAAVRKKAALTNALVIGDVMLDTYIFGQVDRISPEAPVPVVTHQSTEVKAGGAANVALNLAAWGCNTSIIGLIGSDNNGEKLKSLLEKHKISAYLYTDHDRPTTVKTRVVAATHQLMRIDQESTAYIDGSTEEQLMQFIHQTLKNNKPDLIILEDYNKGLLSEKIISLIIEYAKANKVFIAVDPKEVHFQNYTGVNIFKPNWREANLAANKDLQPDDLQAWTAGIREAMDIGIFAVTLGGKGIYLNHAHGDELVATSRMIDVVDVCGAGDAVICALALATISGLDLKKSGALANLTGAYVCSHSGVIAVDPGEIESWI